MLYHYQKKQEVLESLSSNPQTGLSTQQVEKLTEQYGPNRLKEKKKKYEASVQYMYRNKSVQEKLMFIFSAENLSQTYRRMRYVQEYANYQRLQGLEIERKQRQVVSKKKELEQTRKAKENLLKQGETEKAKLEIQEKDRQTLLANLKKKQKGIQNICPAYLT